MYKLFNLYLNFFYVQKCIEKTCMYKVFVRGNNIWPASDASSDFLKNIRADDMMQQKLRAQSSKPTRGVDPNNMSYVG